MTTLKYFIVVPLLSLSITILVGCKSGLIQDLETLEQNHTPYSKSIKSPQKRHIPKSIHKIIDQNYNKRFFSPWKLKRHHFQKKDIMWAFTRFKKQSGYGENKKKLPKNWIAPIEKEANLSTFPNFTQPAITIKNTNLRLLPTKKPHFTHFKHNGEGFPFDNLQNSTIAAGVPVIITHITKRKDWVFVISPFAKGWIQVYDIAYAGPKFRKSYLSHKKFIAITKENIPLLSKRNQFLFDSNIGMIFPKIKRIKNHFLVSVPQTTSKRFAFSEKVLISIKNARTKPVPLTTKNISNIANELLNQPYGWGGSFHNRDCSAMIQDMFVPFGILLPRNSKAQAHKGGIYFDLSKLSPEKKEDLIIKNSIPYLTLVWLPGHIMLYIGQNDDKAIVFHNIWGLRTKDELGRKIIGKSVITTLDPGKDLRNADPNGSLIKRVEGITLLVPRYHL